MANKPEVTKPKPKFIQVQSFKKASKDIELMPFLRKRMSSIGFWPISGSKKYLRWFITIMVIIFNTIPVIIGAAKLLGKNDMMEFVQAFCDCSAMFYWSFRMVYISCYWDSIVLIYKKFQNVWNRISQEDIPEWQEIVKESKKLVSHMSIFVYGLFLVANTAYEIFALWLSMTRHFKETPGKMAYGIHADFIVNTQYNLTLYLIFYFPLAFFQLLFTTSYAAIELLIILLTNYYALYFKLVQIKLKVLNEKLSKMAPKSAKRELIQIIKDHKMAIQCVKEFEAIVKVVLLANFLMNSFVICFFIFAFSRLFHDNIIKFFIFVGFASALHIDLVTLSFYGQKLLNESYAVAVNAYNIAWYEQNVEFQRSVQFMIMRANKPLGLSAAGFYLISLESYYNVLKAAYSYFALMNTFLNINPEE